VTAFPNNPTLFQEFIARYELLVVTKQTVDS